MERVDGIAAVSDHDRIGGRIGSIDPEPLPARLVA